MTTAANKRAKKIVSKTGIYAGLLCYTFILFFPFLIVILTSFTPDAQQLETTKFIWKPDFSLEGYKMVFELDPFKTNNVPSLLQGFINTLWQALIPTVCGLIVSGFASYAYAKFDFPGKSKFFAANLLLMTIPLSAGMTGYLFYNAIGWTTGGASVLPLIVPGIFGSAATIFFIYPYVKALPTSIVEAARMDGIGFFACFFRIVFPLSLPVFLSQFLFGFVNCYNNYSNALIYLMNQQELWTLQLALGQLVSYVQSSGGWDNVACAAAIMSLMPLLLLYLFVQRYFISGITAGSVKG